MKKITLLTLALILSFGTRVQADEGMWLLPLLQKIGFPQMEKMGLRLTAKQIYNINKSSLKDAVIIFGRGCTGELVSDQGLILTNHHCGFDAIQQHSTVEHDYLKDGFWAKTKAEELATPGLTVTFLESFTDVTDQVLAATKDAKNETERSQAIKAKITELTAPYGKNYGERAIVSSFYAGNVYYLIVYKIYEDVRLVGTPPSSIGKFGGDTDNWMWPRHTGDFSVFRVYSDKDGNPAKYSPDNIPYKPKQHLKISLKGVKKGDFTMIMGYPGRTQRYMTSWEVNQRINIENATRIHIRGIRLDIMKKDMEADRKVRIQYASKYAGISNYWKNSIGMNKALKHLKIQDKKEKEEAEFTAWLNSNTENKEKYGNALDLIKNSVAEGAEYKKAQLYIYEALLGGCEIISTTQYVSKMQEMLNDTKISQGKKDTILKEMQKIPEKIFKDYNKPTDLKVTKAMFKDCMENLKDEYKPAIFDSINEKYQGNIDKYIDEMFATSMFCDEEKLEEFLKNPTQEKLDADMASVASKSISDKMKKLNLLLKKINEDFYKGRRLYEAGLLDMNKGKKAMYPDANFTMRLTYGSVQDYYPADAVHYDYITTLDGVMQKEDPENLYEFEVPQRLKDLYAAKDYGQYAMKNGKVPVAFISTNDITGGNSGSPVMNANGELVGIAFDGNWEAMSGDICFEPELQRCINVDIRYVLFIIDKYAGAKNLINEMTIVK